MSNPFFDQPILNSPYAAPTRHWELDKQGQPTQLVVDSRRRADFITPIPKPKKRSGNPRQQDLALADGDGASTEQQKLHASLINEVRRHVETWRSWRNPAEWNVTPTTARLLQHWRLHEFNNQRPFFCQIEAVETAIWFTEVAPHEPRAKNLLANLDAVNRTAAGDNPVLRRLALKLATGAGKTTVMAMLIAWQALNALRQSGSKLFTTGFLICTPGLTIKDRLRVLKPNDPDNYYRSRELVPAELLREMQHAKVVITNYHAFQRRERVAISAGGRALLQGRTGPELDTRETDGEMLHRVMSDLMGMKNVFVLNDEAHHCYREKPLDPDANDADADDGEALKGDDRKEAEHNNEAARLWISGLEVVHQKLGISRVLDLSATPFFLRGSGYTEGTLFPWTMSDFSLMDAIECGIVKLPRVPVSENIPGNELPVFRNLWEHVRADMPKKSRSQSESLDPLKLPAPLQTALHALYGHYQKVFATWAERKWPVPPCFIVVCQNTAISKLVYDFISGFVQKRDDGTETFHNGALELFRNFDEHGNPLQRPVTLLIDSEQLEAGEALDADFKKLAADEIDRFRRERIERGTHHAGEEISDQDLLREVMNTVGKEGQLGAGIRCVVSVAMLTEGWDANTVTHVLGLRAFGTQLLCEQVIGRALRRQSYHLNEQGLFDVEYADVFGIPFDFTAKPVVVKPSAPRDTITVKAVRPDRDALEIRFPRIVGYRIELPTERLEATFNDDSKFVLSPELTGPCEVRMEGIIGQGVDMTVEHLQDMRPSTVLMRLTQRLLYTKFRDPGEEPKLHLFGQLKRITKQWIDSHLECIGGTYPAQLCYMELADRACEKINAAITQRFLGEKPVEALLDPYNQTGTTAHVRFTTTKTDRWQTRADRSHVDWVILDSDWEGEFCRVAEAHPQVRAYVKNQGLGFEVPYQLAGEPHRYRPDFIVLVDDGHGDDDLLHLVVEIKGYRGEDAKEKKATMDTYWVPGVNRLGSHGRWAFAEFREVYAIEREFKAKVQSQFAAMVAGAAGGKGAKSTKNGAKV